MATKILEIIFYIPKSLFNSNLNKKGKAAGSGLIALGGTLLVIGILFDITIVGITIGLALNILGILMMSLGKMIANT